MIEDVAIAAGIAGVAGARHEPIAMPHVVSTLLEECSAITEYRILRDNLPRRLAHLLQCRAVLFYQKVEETLQFVAGSYDDTIGWSSALLSVVHITPIGFESDVLEAKAFITRSAICQPAIAPTILAVPLIYRQRPVGVMVVLRTGGDPKGFMPSWSSEEVNTVEGIADVVALLLENTRLLERDRERIHELSLLNSISTQLNYAFYDATRLHSIILQRVREVTGVDLCGLLEPISSSESIPWISPALHRSLFAHFREHCSSLPLIIERSGGAKHLQDYATQLPQDIKTFFAFPLLRPLDIPRDTLHGGMRVEHGEHGGYGGHRRYGMEQRVLGVVVGAYYHASRLRREDSALLQVISSQAGAALENMRLVADVTEARKEARKLLRRVLEDQRFKELVFESIPSGLITMDMRGRITTFNHAATGILGYHLREVVGQSLYTLLTTTSDSIERREKVEAQGKRTFSSASSLSPALLKMPCDAVQHGVLVTQNRRGQEIVLEMDILPLRDEHSTQVGTAVTFTDMTSMHRLEEEKRRLDRLATLGEMAANVAHEVRNPLASIKASIQMLMDDLATDIIEREETQLSDEPEEEQVTKRAWVQESTSVMLKEVERLDAIVRDLLLFARPRQLHCVPCSLADLSDHVLHLLQKQCTEAHVAICRHYDTVPMTLADMGQIEQVLFNLFTNAIQAMPQGGTLTVSCQCCSPGNAVNSTGDSRTDTSNRGEESQDAPQWLEVQVIDTGVGIAEEQLERIFQPFFTTKAHGIGLGLSITRRLIEDHGGSLHVESRTGCGTTVSFHLPIRNVYE